jgi:glycerol kinase
VAQVLRVDGGMAANSLMMQIQADLLGVEVARPAMLETTALGAAFAAGLAVGVWDSIDGLRAASATERTFESTTDAAYRAARAARWSEAVERSLGWAKE